MMANDHERKFQEREKLKNIISQWNANRLDIFEISEPTENLEFHGVMRFYSLDAGQKVATKCIRVSSTATSRDVIQILIEKFRPDIRMLSVPEYALYEIHENGEERQLELEERPLLVQLNWHKDDREGRFLLRRLDQGKFDLPKIDPSFRRKLSKREKKEKKKKEKKERVKDQENIAERLYNELPETVFTRSISNPEAVMRRRRQQKLERRLQEFRQEGGSDAGGTLRIFGESINRDVPYKTLLLSTRDTAAAVVREMLDKYGVEGADPGQFCLVQVIVPAQPDSPSLREYILDDDDCPLAIERQFNRTKGTLTFHLRRRPADYQARKRKKKLKQPSKGDCMDMFHRGDELNDKLPYLMELLPDGSDVPGGCGKKHLLYLNVTEVGSDRPTSTGGQYLQLLGGLVHPRHCVIAHTEGIVTVTPSSREAETFVNGVRIMETTILQHGALVQFGPGHHVYRFMAPNSAMPQQQLQDLDSGSHVETVSTHSDSCEGRRGTDPVLPAVLELWDSGEEAFLTTVVAHADPARLQFKLAPTYAIYLAARFRASTHYLPEATPTERAHRLTALMSRVAGLVHRTLERWQGNASGLALWLANSAELLHFLKQDRHLSGYTLDCQDLLAEAVQLAFRGLVGCQQVSLAAALPHFLTDSSDHDDTSTGEVLSVLSGAMALLRRCQVNAALTIQLFSQLFHHVNQWLFNRMLDSPGLCTKAWGLRLGRRLARVEAWAEKQGLELAADCHLSRIIQACRLLAAPKSSPDDIASICSKCYKLNSLQVRALLENLVPEPGEAPISPELAQRAARVAESTADEASLSDGRPVTLREDVDLQLPFLLPEDGYSCDVLRGCPPGLLDLLQPLMADGTCNLAIQHNSSGFWTIYMADQDILKLAGSRILKNNKDEWLDIPFTDPQEDQVPTVRTRSPSVVSSSHEPDIQEIRLNKSNHGIGLSIVACGVHQSQDSEKLGIYVKSVVKGGAADLDGRLEPGDQLLKVDGHSLIAISQEKAAELMTRTGPVVTLEVYKHGAIHHGIAHVINKPSPVMHRGSTPNYHPGPRHLSERDLTGRMNHEIPPSGKMGPPTTNGRIQSSKSVPSLNNVADGRGPPVPHPNSRPSYDPPYLNNAASTTSIPKSVEFDGNRPPHKPPMEYGGHMPPHHHNKPLEYDMYKAQHRQPPTLQNIRPPYLSKSVDYDERHKKPMDFDNKPPTNYHTKPLEYDARPPMQSKSLEFDGRPYENRQQPPGPKYIDYDGRPLHAKPMDYQPPYPGYDGRQPPHIRPLSKPPPSGYDPRYHHPPLHEPGPPKYPHGEEYRQSPLPSEEHHYQNINLYNNISRPPGPQRQQHHASHAAGLNTRPHQAQHLAAAVERARPVSTLVSARDQEQYHNSAAALRGGYQRGEPQRPMVGKPRGSPAPRLNGDQRRPPPPPAVSYRYGPSGYPPAEPPSEEPRIPNHASLRPQLSAESSPSPWAREEKEKIQRQRLEEARKARDDEISHLESLSHRSPRQEDRLRTLRLEREFQRRAEELRSQGEEEDEEDDEELLERAESRERLLRVREEVQRVRQRHPDWDGVEDRESRLKELHLKETHRLRELEAAREMEDRLLREAHRRQDEARQRSPSRNNTKEDVPPPLPTSPPPLSSSGESAVGRLDNLLAPPPPERKSSYEATSLRNGDLSTTTTTSAKKVSFQEDLVNGNSDSSYTLQDIDEVLYTATGTTPGVIGAQEVYRDPRQRIEAQRGQPPTRHTPEKLTFREKMKMFAQEAETPREKVKISRAQRDIELSAPSAS